MPAVCFNPRPPQTQNPNVQMWIARGPCGCIVAAERAFQDREERIALANQIGHWMMDGLEVSKADAPVKVGHDTNCRFHLGGR